MKLLSTLALMGVVLMPHIAVAKTGKTCDAIDALISSNEEFVESILEGDPKLRLSTRKAMDDGLRILDKVLSAKTKTASKLVISKLDAAMSTGNTEAAMLTAMDNYALLVEDLKHHLPTTQNVAMLDHAGFSLQALAASGSPDWMKVKAVLEALKADVAVIDGQLGKGPLADVLHHTVDSINAAASESNPKWLNASAQLLLDSVDLLEAKVKNKSAAACK